LFPNSSAAYEFAAADRKRFSPDFFVRQGDALTAAWPDQAIVQRIIAQLPWRQNIVLIER
jgi:hypothetical protein